MPVPDAGVPQEIVDAARAAIKDNRTYSNAGRRFWELSGRIVRCGVCGNRTENRSLLAKTGKYNYFYHSCQTHHQYGDAACTHRKNHRAEKLEAAVWQFVSGLLRNPEQLRAGLEEMIEQERAGMRGDPDRRVKAWLERIAEADRKRSRFQDVAA